MSNSLSLRLGYLGATAIALGCGVLATNSHKVEAATVTTSATNVASQGRVVTAVQTTYVFSDINAQTATGQVLQPNTHWKVIREAYDKQGRKWLDLGMNQWVLACNVHEGYLSTTPQQPKQTYNAQSASKSTSAGQVQATQTQNTYHQSTYQQPQRTYQAQQTTYTQQQTQSQVQQTPVRQQTYQAPAQTQQTASYLPTMSYSHRNYNSYNTSSEQAALNSIAAKESGGSYTARNGRYIGKYQLDAAYLHGDYSPANQERVARQYAVQRYGSVAAAAQFRATHNYW